MRIAIIGCGNMGTGLAEQLGPFHQLSLYDHDWNKAQELAQKVNGEAYQHLLEAVEKAQFILLAIKPQNLKEFSQLLGNHLKSDQLIVSLLAGTPLAVLKHYLENAILVRMMPNLALCYGMGVIGLVDSPDLSIELKKELQDFLSPLGLIYWLKEHQVDSLTSLTGSGPAFIFILIEAMIEAGVAMGFQPKDAQKLILQMLQGCVTLLEKTEQHPAELKWKIASPSGTTIAGIRMMEKQNVRSGLIETFLATHQRALEIAKSHDMQNKTL
jgi:pyrroline-5-carboxylate reductase